MLKDSSAQTKTNTRLTVPGKFEEGDWVLFYHKELGDRTLCSGWTEPHVVVKKLGDANYRLQTKPDGPTKVVHVDNLMIHKTFQIGLQKD